MSKDNFQLRSEKVKQILSKDPNGMIKWGNTIILIIVLLALLLSWFVRYPEIVYADIILSKTNNSQSDYSYFCKTKVGFQDFKRLKKGQELEIRLKSYKHNADEIIIGKIKSISPTIARDGFYLLTINIQTGLITKNVKKDLHDKEVVGIAEIIIKDSRLIERLLYQLQWIFK